MHSQWTGVLKAKYSEDPKNEIRDRKKSRPAELACSYRKEEKATEKTDQWQRNSKSWMTQQEQTSKHQDQNYGGSQKHLNMGSHLRDPCSNMLCNNWDPPQKKFFPTGPGSPPAETHKQVTKAMIHVIKHSAQSVSSNKLRLG